VIVFIVLLYNGIHTHKINRGQLFQKATSFNFLNNKKTNMSNKLENLKKNVLSVILGLCVVFVAFVFLLLAIKLATIMFKGDPNKIDTSICRSLNSSDRLECLKEIMPKLK
jgi:uncharacterized protein YqhQ